MKRILAALALLSAAACGPSGATPPTVAADGGKALALTGRVVDGANLFDVAAEQALTERLVALETETTDQLVVATVPGLEGQSIEKYSLDLANRWGVGSAENDNGVLVLVAPNERKVRVEVGLGLEGLLTDAKAGDVVRAMTSRFKAGDYAGGVSVGVDEIDRLLRSDRRRPQPKPAAMREAA